jgi:hypothetical protein
MHCKIRVLDFLGNVTGESSGAGRTQSTSGSRAASSLREAGLPWGGCRGLAHWRGLGL